MLTRQILTANGFSVPKALPGFIYFIAEEGDDTYIKIGKSAKSIESRLTSLQCGNPRKLYIRDYIEVDNCTDAEYFLHTAFKILRVSGEWFLWGPKIERFLKHAKEHGAKNALTMYSPFSQYADRAAARAEIAGGVDASLSKDAEKGRQEFNAWMRMAGQRELTLEEYAALGNTAPSSEESVTE